MALDTLEKLRSAVRDVPDFPKKGIVFKDITPVLSDPVLFHASIDCFWIVAAGEKSIRSLGSMRADFFLDQRSPMSSVSVSFRFESVASFLFQTEIASYSLDYR